MTATLPSLKRSPNGPSLPDAALSSAADTGSWVEAISHLDPRYGGISAAVPELSSAVARVTRRTLTLAGFCRPDEHFIPARHERVHLLHLPLSRGAWLRTAAPKHSLSAAIRDAAGIHIHGLWQQHSAVAASLARRSQRPYIVSAHGMLERWAMGNKGLKKTLYLALVERRNLQNAACLHALTTAERDDYRRLGLTNPVAVIPNGVHIPADRNSAPFLAQFPHLAGKRIVLFLGRLHGKKGLDLLCRAWSSLPASPDIHLVLAGPDFEGTRARLEQTVQQLGIDQRVTFTGMLAGSLKWSALAASSLFVLPSYSEGLSVSVLEAMGSGVPVLITHHCNLPEAAIEDAGVVIPAQAEALTAALSQMLGASPAHLAAMGQRGAQLVASRYSWNTVGQQMNLLYRWVENGASTPAPDGLHLDLQGRTQ